MAAMRTKASLLYHSKIQLLHRNSEEIAIAELKIWSVPASVHYPEGKKYSLYLVWKENGVVIFGFDNHKPKGPHLHRNSQEEPYEYLGDSELIDEFWFLAKKEGFLV